MSENGEIRAALEAQLATVTGIPDATRRLGENTLGDLKPDGQAWVTSRMAYGIERVLTMPADGGIKRRDGTWRLLLRFPLGTGVDAGDTLSQAVADAFPRGLSLVSGSTTVHCDGARRYSGGRDIDEGWYIVPVDITWHVHTTNTVP